MPWFRSVAVFAVLAAWLFVPVAVHAGGGPQNLALVVNPDDPDSLGIANFYIELRQIPPSNVIYIPWRADLFATTGVQFRDRLLKPLVDELEKRGLSEQIDFVAFSSGYPYLVDCTQLFPSQQFPRQARPTTSLTSATYLYQLVLNGRAEMFGLNSNAYYSPAANGVTKSWSYSTVQEALETGAARGASGKKYLLATALGITSGHGNTGKEITACLRRAKQADGMKPRGTIYYMQNNDIRSKVRQAGCAAAVRELAAIGVSAVVLPGIAPTNKPDVAGLTTGAANVDLKNSRSTLLPGALVDNLTSAGGQMLIRQENNPQTRISEYIRLGAAGASGAVVEPYAIAEKFPSPALHVHYARGCSLAEAYYQSIAAPLHLLIIGDPLCQPWAVAPAVTVAGVGAEAPLSGVATITPTASYPDSRKASRFELYVNGVRNQSVGAGAAFSLDTTTLADGQHELRVIVIDNTPIAVQGAWIGAAQVKNGDGALELTLQEKRAAIGGTVRVEVSSPLKGVTQIMHNGRRVGVAPGGSGRVEIEAKRLGKGRTTLHAEQGGKTPLRSAPVVVEIY